MSSGGPSSSSSSSTFERIESGGWIGCSRLELKDTTGVDGIDRIWLWRTKWSSIRRNGNRFIFHRGKSVPLSHPGRIRVKEEEKRYKKKYKIPVPSNLPSNAGQQATVQQHRIKKIFHFYYAEFFAHLKKAENVQFNYNNISWQFSRLKRITGG